MVNACSQLHTSGPRREFAAMLPVFRGNEEEVTMSIERSTPKAGLSASTTIENLNILQYLEDMLDEQVCILHPQCFSATFGGALSVAPSQRGKGD